MSREHTSIPNVQHEFDSNFRRVIVTARRARQIQNGSHPLVDSSSAKASKIAQQEISAGLVAHVRRETQVLKPGVEAPEVPKFIS